MIYLIIYIVSLLASLSLIKIIENNPKLPSKGFMMVVILPGVNTTYVILFILFALAQLLNYLINKAFKIKE